VDADRAITVAAAIEDAAGAEGVPVAVRHVCLACVAMVGVSGVGLSLVSDLGSTEPLFATSPAAERIMEAQLTLGEGPTWEVMAHGRPVLVPDLADEASMRRWPAFVPVAIATPTSAVFAFPLALGAILVGVLEIYRETAGSLSATELADILLFTDAATVRVLDQLSGDIEDAISPDDGFTYRWAEVHQATGIVSVQLDITLTNALLRLRAHAYLTGRRLSEVARDVLTGKLRLASDEDDQTGEQRQG
jgi:hypothetical protein